MKYKMFVADFDGTLGKAPNYISKNNLKAIKAYQEKGGNFVICTGRMLKSITVICKLNGLTGQVIAYQGGVIADVESGEVIFDGGLDYKMSKEIVDALSKEVETVLIYINGVLYYNKRTPYSEIYEKLCTITGREEPNLNGLLERYKTSTKIMELCDEENVEPISKKIQEKFGDKILVNSGAKCLIEVINPEHSKGKAVKRLAEHYGIKEDEIITMGDSTNDITMIEVGYGIAVGDGNEELKKHAKEVTVEFEKDPVAEILKKYCL